MIQAKTTRRLTHDGKPYAKGDAIAVSKAQFADLGPDGLGWIERASAEKKAADTKPAPKAD